MVNYPDFINSRKPGMFQETNHAKNQTGYPLGLSFTPHEVAFLYQKSINLPGNAIKFDTRIKIWRPHGMASIEI